VSKACQGLPTGPCPDGHQDKTVKYTIYDLFLCPSCEQARETIEVEELRSKREADVDDETTKAVTIKRERKNLRANSQQTKPLLVELKTAAQPIP
jgi:uncharacterized protein (DUF2225 family)